MYTNEELEKLTLQWGEDRKGYLSEDGCFIKEEEK